MLKIKLPEDVGDRVEDLTVPRSNNIRDITVSGHTIAKISSAPHNDRDRWTELFIIESDSGNFVGISAGRSVLPNESDIVDSSVAQTLDGLIEFFTVKGRRSGLSIVLFDQVKHRMTQASDRV